MKVVRVVLVIYFLVLPLIHAKENSCRGMLIRTADQMHKIFFFDGEQASELSFPAGVAGSGRLILRRKTPDGNRIYRHISARTFSREAEAVAAMKTDRILNQTDEQFMQAARHGGPEYFGVELIQIAPEQWSYFSVMRDYSSSEEKYFTLKGLLNSGDVNSRQEAKKMLEQNPGIMKSLARDLVQDCKVGTLRVDPDFILRSDGIHWIDPAFWQFNHFPKETVKVSADLVANLISTIGFVIDSQISTKNFIGYFRNELRGLQEPFRSEYFQQLSTDLRKIIKQSNSIDNGSIHSIASFVKELEENRLKEN